MKNTNKPSPSELTILKVLWKTSPLSAREIHEQVASQLQWSYSSSRKTIDRMVDKNYIRYENSHGIKIFSSKINKIKTLARYVTDFAHRVLEVQQPLPVSMFADSDLLDENELKELEKLLNEESSEDV